MQPYSHMIEHVGLRCISLFTQSDFANLYEGFKDNPVEMFQPPTEQKLECLRELLQHAYDNVSFYRRRMDACGFRPGCVRALEDLERLAPTTKQDIGAHFPDEITDKSCRYKPWRYRSTSGSVERLTVLHDYRKRDSVRASELFALYSASGYRPGMKYLEIPPDVCRHVCGSKINSETSLARFIFENTRTGQLFYPEVISDLRGILERQVLYRRLVLAADTRNGAVHSPEYLDQSLREIRAFRPYVIKALPLHLYALACHVLDRNIEAPDVPGGLMPMGSSMAPSMKRTIQSAFATRVHEDYGSAELGAIGAECYMHNGIHPFNRLFHLEVILDGRAARPGETGRVLITDLRNFAMPMIRYDIGDVASVLPGQCGCGAGSLRITVQGRVQDCLRTSDGLLVTSDAITDVMLNCPGVLIYQLECEDQNIDVQLVPRAGREINISQVCAALSRLIGSEFNISARIAPTILPETGGKYRFVRNRHGSPL